MRPRMTIPSWLAGLAVSAALVGCGETADQKAPAPSSALPSTAPRSSTSSATAPADAGKGPGTSALPAGGGSPKVDNQPAAPTQTPADAAKDKGKAGEGEVKKETPPKGA